MLDKEFERVIVVVDKRQFGNYIKEKRMEIGLTQEEFAAQLYISPTAVSKWENGKTYPDITIISQICMILKISEHEFISACDDTQMRKTVYEANKYREYAKIKKVKIHVLNALFVILWAGIFIVSFAVNELLWFCLWGGMLGIPYSIFVLPYYIRKEKSLMSLLGANLSLLIMSFVGWVVIDDQASSLASICINNLLIAFFCGGIWLCSRFSRYRLSFNFLFIGIYWYISPYLMTLLLSFVPANAYISQAATSFDRVVYMSFITAGCILLFLQKKQMIRTAATPEKFQIMFEDSNSESKYV